MTLPSKLPTPSDLPAADIVIYDGHCQFCTRQVQRLYRWDGGKRLAFLSLHEPSVRQIAPNLSHEQLMEKMYVVTQKGQQYGGAEAFRYLTCRIPRLWPLAPCLHIPLSLPLWQWMYRQVAKRRYRFNRQVNGQTCENDACHVHFK